MKIVIFDPAEVRLQLLPLTYTRPVGALRMGVFTMAERWQHLLPGDYYWSTEEYLKEFYSPAPKTDDDTIHIAGNIVGDKALAAAINALHPGQTLCHNGSIVAWRGNGGDTVDYDGDILAVEHIYDLFVKNDVATDIDWELLTSGRKSAPIDASVTVIGDPSRVFLEEGATAIGCTINTMGGPVYLGPATTVMEGCCLRGPVTLCEHAQCNMGTKVYGPTTLGPYCKVGGELNNVVMIGYSNKAHDGFLGNAVLGEWCNLGAGTVASNLKNDYSEIKLWNYPAGRFLRTGLQFCGLIMGDHSKSAINTSFNTATTVGVGCNIISEGMPRVFIPSFLKGGTSGFDNVNLNEFFTVASRVMARRGITLSDAHKRMYQAIFDFADKFK